MNRDVIDGTFEVNEIITEGQLIQRYGVSKSPVREALISLCDEQVLQSIPRTGYRVVQIMPDEMREIAETRQAMELFMFEKSFPALDKEAVAKLREQALGRQRGVPPSARLLCGQHLYV